MTITGGLSTLMRRLLEIGQRAGENADVNLLAQDQNTDPQRAFRLGHRQGGRNKQKAGFPITAAHRL
jgi:general stress protein YciG